jgi:hypothetical protein
VEALQDFMRVLFATLHTRLPPLLRLEERRVKVEQEVRQERQETLLRERVQPAEQAVQEVLAERSTLVVL